MIWAILYLALGLLFIGRILDAYVADAKARRVNPWLAYVSAITTLLIWPIFIYYLRK